MENRKNFYTREEVVKKLRMDLSTKTYIPLYLNKEVYTRKEYEEIKESIMDMNFS